MCPLPTSPNLRFKVICHTPLSSLTMLAILVILMGFVPYARLHLLILPFNVLLSVSDVAWRLLLLTSSGKTASRTECQEQPYPLGSPTIPS